jgi:hypothetical protein
MLFHWEISYTPSWSVVKYATGKVMLVEDSPSTIQTAADLWIAGNAVSSIMLYIYGVGIPITKLAYSLLCVFKPRFKNKKAMYWVMMLNKFAAADTFVCSIIFASMNSIGADTSVRQGVVYFLLFVVIVSVQCHMDYYKVMTMPTPREAKPLISAGIFVAFMVSMYLFLTETFIVMDLNKEFLAFKFPTASRFVPDMHDERSFTSSQMFLHEHEGIYGQMLWVFTYFFVVFVPIFEMCWLMKFSFRKSNEQTKKIIHVHFVQFWSFMEVFLMAAIIVTACFSCSESYFLVQLHSAVAFGILTIALQCAMRYFN